MAQGVASAALHQRGVVNPPFNSDLFPKESLFGVHEVSGDQAIGV